MATMFVQADFHLPIGVLQSSGAIDGAPHMFIARPLGAQVPSTDV